MEKYRNGESNVLRSFTSLLSSARSFGVQEAVHPRPEPGLSKFLSSEVVFDSSNPYCSHICSMPSLCLKNKVTEGMCSAKNMSRQETAAFNLAFPVFHDHENVAEAPVTLLNNFSVSFMSLIESRMRTSIVALSECAQEIARSQEGTTLVNLLSGSGGSSPITLTTIVTSFRALGCCENSDEDALYLPLVFEATVDAMVLGTLVTCTVSAPGTIIGTFHGDGLLERVEILFDSIALLNSMMKEARFVVRKVIARAAGMAHKLISQVLSILSSDTIKESLDLYDLPHMENCDHQIPHKPALYNSQVDNDVSHYKQFLSGQINHKEALSQPPTKPTPKPAKYNAQIDTDVHQYLNYLSGVTHSTPSCYPEIKSNGTMDDDTSSSKRKACFSRDTMKRRKVSFCKNC